MTRASTPPCRAGLAAFAVGAVLAGCGVPVAVNLDEPEANRVVAALDANGVAADRAQEPGGARHFRVEVSRGDAARAVAVLTQEELPRRPSPGLLEALGEGALVPSRAAEQARIAVGTAGELERTLASADGVVSARVHLSVPPRDPLADSAAEPPRASVLLRYRGAQAPLPEEGVKRLVAAAVPGLTEAHVAVVAIAAPGGHAAAPTLVRVGPFSTTSTMAGPLRATIMVAAALNVVLVAALSLLWVRLRRGAAPARAPAVQREGP